MRLFAQLSWYFRREWRRYLGAIALLAIIAVLQLIPPKVVGIVVDGVTRQHYTAEKVWMWIGALVLIAVMVYLLRYVWRVLLFGASYQLAVELREDFYRQLSRQHPAFYLRHRTGDLIARATNDVDRVVFAAGEGVLTLVDSMVMGCAVLIVMSTQISWQLTLLALLPMPVMALVIKRNGDALHERFRVAQAAFSSLNDRTQESLTSIRMIKAFWPGGPAIGAVCCRCGGYRRKTCVWRALMRALIRLSYMRLARLTCWRSAEGAGWCCRQYDPWPTDQLCDVSRFDDLADAGAGMDV
ncbi:Probable multidrug resistance ABC transporter ATP-binding/permease protein YheI [Raoultella planticola]|uniref:Probable multidrug resistance ABC transporter ATP-binding/permease protein YheI n=1 Tax=Raoultella planticola TaxID=575 RepID=A0A485DB90_RAOPL|nr:Probable multidrug resistance ABC transporter ATP-binding/permease protein YheI [Raoultella planticola]